MSLLGRLGVPGWSHGAGANADGQPRASGGDPPGGAPGGAPGGGGGGQGWEVNLGPVAFGSRGIDVKPQFKVGVEVANFDVEAGFSDVRDGLRFAVKADASLVVRAKGRTLAELHDSVQCDTPGFHEALAGARRLLAAWGPPAGGGAGGEAPGEHGVDRQAVEEAAEAMGVSAGALQAALHEGDNGPPRLELRVKASTGVGVSAAVCLGWCDTKGYRMVGVGGKVRAMVKLGATIFAGRHHSGESAKLIIGIGNFTFEYTFPLRARQPDADDACRGVAPPRPGPAQADEPARAAPARAAPAAPAPAARPAPSAAPAPAPVSLLD